MIFSSHPGKRKKVMTLKFFFRHLKVGIQLLPRFWRSVMTVTSWFCINHQHLLAISLLKCDLIGKVRHSEINVTNINIHNFTEILPSPSAFIGDFNIKVLWDQWHDNSESYVTNIQSCIDAYLSWLLTKKAWRSGWILDLMTSQSDFEFSKPLWTDYFGYQPHICWTPCLKAPGQVVKNKFAAERNGCSTADWKVMGLNPARCRLPLWISIRKLNSLFWFL